MILLIVAITQVFLNPAFVNMYYFFIFHHASVPKKTMFKNKFRTSKHKDARFEKVYKILATILFAYGIYARILTGRVIKQL